MKSNLKYIALGVLMSGLFSCADEVENTGGVQEQEVRVFGSVMSNSRVSFEQDGNVTHASWNNGDKIGLYADNQKNLGYVVSTDGAGTVEFKAESEVLKCMDGTIVTAYYPYSDLVEDMIVPLPKTSNYVWSAMKPFVYASDVVENSSVSLKFKHPFAYLKVSFSKSYLPEWASQQVLNSIEISTDNKILGVDEGYFNLNSFEQKLVASTSTVTIDADNFDLGKSDFTCYIPVLPQGAAEPITFKFIQKNGTVSDVLFTCKKNTSAEGLLAGYVYEVALNDEELPLSPEKLKSRIDAIGKEFVGNFKASEFNEIKNTTRYIKETFCVNKDSVKAVTNWYDACLEAITLKGETRDTTKFSENVYTSSSYLNEYYYHYADLTRTYAASQFVGHFVISNGIWVKEEGNFTDLQFTAPDEDGNLCTLTVTTSGDTKKVYIGDERKEDWYNWTEEQRDSILYNYIPTGEVDSITGLEKVDTVYAGIHTIHKYTSDVDVNTYDNYVFIPEKIFIEYTQGSSTILNTTITTDHSALQSDRFDIAAEDLSVLVETQVNGFEFIMSKMVYDAGNNVEVACKLNKNGINLLTMSASSGLALTGDIYDSNIEVDSCQNAKLNLDILHQMQLNFTCSDALKVDEHMDLAEANDTIEATYKEQLVEINKLMTGGLYFDGQATQQAWITVEPFQEEDYWDGSLYWTWEPVLNFSDGSNYSTFSTFFNEDDFKSLINLAWDVFDDFVNLGKQFARDGL